jgi:hypothetical protein
MLRIALLRLAKRHIQPERYAKWVLKLVGIFCKKYWTKLKN